MQKLLKEWQKRLDLSDWVIKLNDNVSPNNMTLQQVQGECNYEVIGKTAVINLISEKDYGNRIVPFDKETTLVHELLHCKFAILDDSGNSLYDKMLHQLIEDMAKALVKAKRQV